MEKIYLTQSLQDYEREIWDYQKEYMLIEQKIEGAPQLNNMENFNQWLEYLENFKEESSILENYVPSREYLLVKECGGEKFLIGMINLRLALNEYFNEYGGHVGISIAPNFQGKGYGTQALKLILEEAKKMKMKKLLINCEEKNIASAKIIEKNGGIFESQVHNPV